MEKFSAFTLSILHKQWLHACELSRRGVIDNEALCHDFMKKLSLWSTMLVMFLVEVLLPIPFSFAIFSSVLIGLIYLAIEAFAIFGK